MKHFSVERQTRQSAEFQFRAVCQTKLNVGCLVHDLGARLRCGAHVRFAERIRVGDFTLEEAWEVEALMEHIAALRRTAFLKDYHLYDQMKHMYWRPIGPRTSAGKRSIKRQRQYDKRERRRIALGVKEPIQTALCY